MTDKKETTGFDINAVIFRLCHCSDLSSLEVCSEMNVLKKEGGSDATGLTRAGPRNIQGCPEIFGETVPRARESSPGTKMVMASQRHSLCRAGNGVESLAYSRCHPSLSW